MFGDRNIVEPIAGSPRAAVHFEHRRKRTLPFRTIKPREQRCAARMKVFQVFDVDRHYPVTLVVEP